MRRALLACIVLATVGCGPSSTEDWLQQLKAPEVVKRREAIRKLGSRTGDADAIVPALQEALADENGYVRHDAAVALGKFGPAARPAAPALVAALKDREVTVRLAAADALKKIDPSMAKKPALR